MTTPPHPPILRLLGGALIEADGVPVGGAAAHRHRLALLALLAVNKRPVSRDKLMAYLWPERDTDSARGLLRTALYELRKLLGDDAIRRTGDTLSIDPAFLRCDVLEFEAAVNANDFGNAATLYTGAFLDGFFLKDALEFEHWVDEERTRLERAYARVRATVDEAPPLAAIERANADIRPIAPVPVVEPPHVATAPGDPAQIDERTPKRELKSRALALTPQGGAECVLLEGVNMLSLKWRLTARGPMSNLPARETPTPAIVVALLVGRMDERRARRAGEVCVSVRSV